MNLEDVVIIHESERLAWRNAKNKDARAPACLYCGHLITRKCVEFDHFPVPDICGGTQVASACETCHSMKDRFSLASWPIAMVASICRDHAALAPLLSAVMAKDRAQIEREAARWREFWEDIGTDSRIAFGKFASVGLGRYGQTHELADDGLTLVPIGADEAKATGVVRALLDDGVTINEIVSRVASGGPREPTPPTPQSDT